MSTVLLKTIDYGHSIINNKTQDQQTLYKKALADKAGINLRHLIAVEDGRELATQQDIEAISRAFHVKAEEWLR